jgi:hypothetical protein
LDAQRLIDAFADSGDEDEEQEAAVPLIDKLRQELAVDLQK